MYEVVFDFLHTDCMYVLLKVEKEDYCRHNKQSRDVMYFLFYVYVLCTNCSLHSLEHGVGSRNTTATIIA